VEVAFSFIFLSILSDATLKAAVKTCENKYLEYP
jgi:hypothetical protein